MHSLYHTFVVVSLVWVWYYNIDAPIPVIGVPPPTLILEGSQKRLLLQLIAFAFDLLNNMYILQCITLGWVHHLDPCSSPRQDSPLPHFRPWYQSVIQCDNPHKTRHREKRIIKWVSINTRYEHHLPLADVFRLHFSFLFKMDHARRQ